VDFIKNLNWVSMCKLPQKTLECFPKIKWFKRPWDSTVTQELIKKVPFQMYNCRMWYHPCGYRLQLS
jgi:hypothetical protein